jgi:hypothetical protein
MTLHDLKERLNRRPEILFAFLFGSRHNGRPRPDSDWDVAIYLDDALTAKERFDLRRHLSAELEDLGKVDLVVLNEAPPILAHEALCGERLLMRDRSRFASFLVLTLGLAEDQRYWLKIHRQAQLRRLREGTFGQP